MGQPGVSLRAVLNRAARSAALLWDGKANLDKPAACGVSTTWQYEALQVDVKRSPGLPLLAVEHRMPQGRETELFRFPKW